MDPSTLRALAEEMGITRARLDGLRRARSFEEACRQLEAFKDEVNRSYKKLAFKYHPDRNSDPTAEAKFKALAPIRDQVLALRLQPPMRQQRVTAIHYRSAGRVVPQPAVNSDVFRRAYATTSTSTSSTTATYDARRVVFIRVG